jgi:cardiolipin synthase
MAALAVKASGARRRRSAAESRRWLKRRPPRRQLYRLAPQRPRPKPFGSVEFADRVRGLLRAWIAWLAAAGALLYYGLWPMALVAAVMAILLFNAGTATHPAMYPLDVDLDVDSAELQATMEGVTGMPFVPGNRVVVYNNGDEFYPAMLEAIESASQSVTMEQYIYWDGAVGRRFAEAFAERARAGVPVKLLLDAIGSATLGNEIFRILEAGGCQLAWYHPVHWYTLARANLRDHRKSLIIDGRLAFTGGAGLADHWLGTASTPTEWRDIQVAVSGPAAMVQQSGFAQNWLEVTGEILAGFRFFPEPREEGAVKVQTVSSSPSTGVGAVGTMYLTVMQCARRELLVANPYFVPDARFVDVLIKARARGVRVLVLLTGEQSDVWWARQNSLRRYGRLLDAGVEIYEYAKTMLHQKTMIVDARWATVGTANFDNRSFALNEETNLCFYDRAVTEELRSIFMADLRRSVRVEAEAWRRRGVFQQMKEQLASLIEHQI